MATRRPILIAAQPLDGGVAAHVIQLVEGLAPQEFEINVACPRESTTWQELDGRDGVVLHRIRPDRQPGPGDAATLASLMPLVRRAEVIHAHSSKAGFLARLAALTAGRRRRCIFTPHGWSFWAAEGAQSRTYVGLERMAAHWCHLLVALSQAERAAGLAAGVGREEQYRVILNGVDVERFSITPQPVPDRIVVVTRFAPPKRNDLLVEAFASIRRTRPHAELHIVGDGPNRGALERQIGELGVEGAVRLLGRRDDVPEILSRAACFAFASDYEGCPLAVIEAMAAGVPVVATGVGGVPELVADGESGLVVVPGGAAALAAALEAVLADPARAGGMGRAGRTIARSRLSHERMIGDLLGLYEEVATGGE
jgi:glycosyltransferase involved in cell wall biosynthesis